MGIGRYVLMSNPVHLLIEMGEGHRTDLYEVVDQRYLGDEAFVEGVEKRVGTDERPRCVEMSWGEIQEAVCRRLSVSPPTVLHRGHGGVRQICGEAGNNFSVPNISMSSFPHVSSGNPVVCALFYILDSRQKHSGMTPL